MIKISQMSGKLEGIQALNTDTTTNPFCLKMQKISGSICAQCYSMRMLKTYRKNCVPVFKDNGERLSKHLSYDDIPRIGSQYFRVSAHGELSNITQLINVMKIVTHNPRTFFGIWTKRTDLVGQWLGTYKKPENCNLVYSNPFVDKVCMIPPGFDKVFNVVSDERETVNCRGKCIDCLLCYTKNNVRQITEVIKHG